MILAEDVLLLLTNDTTGKTVVDKTRLDLALAGAVLLDLTTAGRVDVAGPGGAGQAGPARGEGYPADRRRHPR